MDAGLFEEEGEALGVELAEDGLELLEELGLGLLGGLGLRGACRLRGLRRAPGAGLLPFLGCGDGPAPGGILGPGRFAAFRFRLAGGCPVLGGQGKGGKALAALPAGFLLHRVPEVLHESLVDRRFLLGHLELLLCRIRIPA